jgi:hypothetical protein
MNLIAKQFIDELYEQDVYLPDGNVLNGGFGESEALSNRSFYLACT